MESNRLFDFGGLNFWIIASGNGLNLVLEVVVLVLSVMVVSPGGVLGQTILMLGTFLSPALVAFICGRMERERYLHYAFYTLPGNLIVTVPSIFIGGMMGGVMGGMMGALLVIVAILGAFNGARVAQMTVRRHAP